MKDSDGSKKTIHAPRDLRRPEEFPTVLLDLFVRMIAWLVCFRCHKYMWRCILPDCTGQQHQIWLIHFLVHRNTHEKSEYHPFHRSGTHTEKPSGYKKIKALPCAVYECGTLSETASAPEENPTENRSFVRTTSKTTDSIPRPQPHRNVSRSLFGNRSNFY